MNELALFHVDKYLIYVTLFLHVIICLQD